MTRVPGKYGFLTEGEPDMTYHRFEELKTYSKRKFCRTVGIKPENFSDLAARTQACVKKEHELCPVETRGKKSVKLTFEDKILLTLYIYKKLSFVSCFRLLFRNIGILCKQDIQ